MGLKAGFKFYMFVAGPFGLKRTDDDRIKLYLEKDISLWGGIGATVPTNDSSDNYKKFGHVLLGGPIASLVFGMLWLPLGLYTKNDLFLLLGIIPLSMGVVSLIPLRNGAFYTDGGRWLRMHRNGKTQAVELALWNLMQKSLVQGSYKKVNFDDIMTLKDDEDTRTKYVGHYYAYCFFKDNKDIVNMEKERTELERLRGKVPKQMVTMYSID